jgi:hypothetical protein
MNGFHPGLPGVLRHSVKLRTLTFCFPGKLEMLKYLQLARIDKLVALIVKLFWKQ